MTSAAAWTTSIAIAIVLLASSFSKIRSPSAVVDTVHAYGLLPRGLGTALALLLGPVEGAIAVWLLSGTHPVPAMLAALALFTTFLVATASVIRAGTAVPCGCFGNATEVVSKETVRRLLILIIGAASVLAVAVVDGSLPRLPDVPSEKLGVAVAILTIEAALLEIAVARWFLRIDHLSGLVRSLLGRRNA